MKKENKTQNDTKENIITYYDKTKIIRKTKKEIKADAKSRRNTIKNIKAFYESQGITSKEEQKALSILLFRYKRNNVYNTFLYNVYIEEYGKQAYFNLCYIVAHDNNLTDYKGMYKDLTHAIQNETAVTRKSKAKQVYRPLSYDELLKETHEEPKTTEDIENAERKIDILALYDYIENELTPSQYKTLKLYLTSGKKIHTDTKKRIVERLRNETTYNLLKYTL